MAPTEAIRAEVFLPVQRETVQLFLSGDSDNISMRWVFNDALPDELRDWQPLPDLGSTSGLGRFAAYMQIASRASLEVVVDRALRLEHPNVRRVYAFVNSYFV